MLKCLAIVGLSGILAAISLLPAQTAPLSSPKQGVAKPSSSQNGSNQAQTQDSKEGTPNLVVSAQQPATPTCDEACQQGRQNLVIQRKLEWFTGVLAIVGVLQMVLIGWQAFLLCKTRGDVKRQADWMETQAGHMSKQAGLMEKQLLEMQSGSAVAKDSAHAARVTAKATALNAVAAEESAKAANAQIQLMKAKERARLIVTPIGFKETAIVPWDFSYLQMKVSNEGFSAAVNISAKVAVFTTPNKTALAPHGLEERAIDPFITSRASTVLEILYVDEHEIDKMDLTEPGSTSKQFRTGVAGIVTYEDVFGDRHETSFRYEFVPYSVEIKDMGGGWKSYTPGNSRGWERSEKAEDNRAT
jgi:hypothetical protein